MNVFSVVSEYIDRLLPSDDTMKVLLLDEETLPIVSVAYSQTMLLDRGVFLVDQLSHTQRKSMPMMHCIVFVRPTDNTIRLLASELAAHRYCGYSLAFSNAVTTEALNQLAMSDAQEAVHRVEEVFADFVAMNRDLVTFPAAAMSQDRALQGIGAVCLALRRRPALRASKSAAASQIAQGFSAWMRKDAELFDFKARDSLILVVDRADDPVTPLLTQWTYQAMMHELVGLQNNRAVIPGADEGFVFCQQDDSFFANNMFSNWGDLCQNLKAYVDEFKSSMNIDKSTASLAELRNLLASLPQAKALSSSVNKHTTVVTHLSEVIKSRRLLDISLLEQHITTESDPQDQWERIMALSADATVAKGDIARLCLLYNLKYEKSAQGSKAESLLMETEFCMLVRRFRQYFGERSASDLLGTGMVKSVISYIKGFKDEQNVYTQHEPLLKKQLQAVLQGGTKVDSDFPYTIQPTTPAFKPKEIIVFMAGGATYEEASLINTLNTTQPFGDVRFLLCSTSMLSTAEFFRALDHDL